MIFMRDHFQYSLCGLSMLPVQFCAILRWQTFSHAQTRTLVSRITCERSFNNFCAQPHPIFVIWPKYATRAIRGDSETATFLARPIAHANILALLGMLRL